VGVSKYVYGVIPASVAPPSIEGIDGAPVLAIASDDIAAIVSDVPDGELQAGREALTVHARVLEQALEGGVVLPMRFGVVLADDEAVREELLERFRPELARQLDELEGKVELHVRAVYEEAALMADVVRRHPQVAALREALRGQAEDATYFERIRLGEMVAGAVAQRRETDAEEIIDALSPIALATEVGGVQHERMVVSASFLVERDQIREFDAAVDELGRRHADTMRFKYTGPLPAHSFVELSLQA
jgi:hypothetical protein